MAYALRFDSITVNPSGTIDVFYTDGTAPLGAASGKGIQLQSRIDAVARKNNLINNFSDQEMIWMAIAIYSIAASDPNLTGATALAGKTLTFDATKPGGALVYG